MRHAVKLFLLSSVLFSCRSMSVVELKPEGPLTKRLPPLEIQVDIYSLEKAYASVVSGVGTNVINEHIIPLTETRPHNYRDEKIKDALTLYGREADDNILNSAEKKKGYLVFKVLSGGPKKGGNFLGVLGVCTLWIPNLLGVPIGNHKAEFQIELIVMDSKKNIVGRYTGYGKHKTWIHVGGYSAKNAQRVANIRALKKAFLMAKHQMEPEIAKLENLLTTTIVNQY